MTSKEDLLKKLVSGTCSQADLRQLFDLIQEEESIDEKEMKAFWDQTDNFPALKVELRERIHGRAKDKIRALAVSEHTNPVRARGRRSMVKQIFKYAAAASIVLALGYAVTIWLADLPEDQLVYVTDFGERQSITLPDGSLVTLNADSEMRVDRNWAPEGGGEVWLSGEAFFEVVKKTEPSAKFSVHTTGLTVDVMGTAFNVHNRNEETKVFLEEGSINLNLDRSGSRVQMKPGEMLRYSATFDRILEHKSSSKEKFTSWKDGTLLFVESVMKDVLSRMEEIYGIHIEVTDPAIYDRRVSLGVPIEDVEIAMTVLARGMNLRFTRSQENFLIESLK